jgi:hypothetical protein
MTPAEREIAERVAYMRKIAKEAERRKRKEWSDRVFAPTELHEIRDDAVSSVRIRLRSSAREVIVAETRRSQRLLEAHAVEVGGHLLAHRDGIGWELEALPFTGDRRLIRRVELDDNVAHARLRQLEEFEGVTDAFQIGVWHSHPTATYDERQRWPDRDRRQPSEHDRKNSVFNLRNRPYPALSVDIVVTENLNVVRGAPGFRGWRDPVFNVWVTTLDDRGRGITERGELI